MARDSLSSVRISNRAALGRLRAQLEGYSEAEILKAHQRAAASTRRRFEPAAKRQIRATYNVRLRDLSGQFRVQSGADEGGEYLALAASTKRIPLINFGARWRRGQPVGATAQVRKGRARTYDSAFIATVHGERHVFERQFNRVTGKRDPRNKLRRLMGPSPFQMLEGHDGHEANAGAVLDEVMQFHRREVLRQFGLKRKQR